MPLDVDLFGEIVKPQASSMLAQKFGAPPFSVLSARDGDWQSRKRQWLALGIQSELGRGDTAVNTPHEGGDLLVGSSLCAQGINLSVNRGADVGQLAGRDAEGVELLPRPGGRKADAAPGGGLMPSCDYSKRQRGDGRGRAIA